MADDLTQARRDELTALHRDCDGSRCNIRGLMNGLEAETRRADDLETRLELAKEELHGGVRSTAGPMGWIARAEAADAEAENWKGMRATWQARALAAEQRIADARALHRASDGECVVCLVEAPCATIAALSPPAPGEAKPETCEHGNVKCACYGDEVDVHWSAAKPEVPPPAPEVKPEPVCDGRCLSAADVSVPEAGGWYALDPDCSLHGPAPAPVQKTDR